MSPDDFEPRAGHQFTFHVPPNPQASFDGFVVRCEVLTLLIVPAAFKWMPYLTPVPAAVLAVETLGLAAFYARYSLKLTAANALVWAAVMALLVAFVAFGRYGLDRRPDIRRAPSVPSAVRGLHYGACRATSLCLDVVSS